MRGNLTKKENSTFVKILKEYQSGQNNRGGNFEDFNDKPELQESYILHIKKYWTNYLGLQNSFVMPFVHQLHITPVGKLS